MKKQISLLLLFINFITPSVAQITTIIPAGFLGVTDAQIVGDNMYILVLGPTGDSEFRIVDLSDTNPSVQNTFFHPDAVVFEIDGATTYINGLFGDISQVDTNNFSNETILASIPDITFDSIVIGNFLYFTAGSSLSRLDLTNPVMTETVVSLNFPQGLALIGNELFITDNDNIVKINITDTVAQTELVVSGLNAPSSLIASGSMLYIGEFNDATSRIYSLDTSMSNPLPTELAINSGSIVGLNIYEDDLYFVSTASGSLLRLDNVLSIPDATKPSTNITVYPNPSNGTFQFSNLENVNVQEINIYDISGRLISRTKYNTNQHRSRVSLKLNLSAGTYIALISTETGILTRKLIIE